MTVRYFRLLVIASFVVNLVSAGVDFGFPSLLPEAFHQAQRAQDFAFSMPRKFFLSTLGVIALFASLASYYGLYMLRPWAPRLSLIYTALLLFFYVSGGTLAQSGLTNAAAYLASYLWGAVVILAITTPFSAQFQGRDVFQAPAPTD